MKISAIVYTSNTGHTEQYARLLAGRTGLAAYSLQEAQKQLSRGAHVLYLGWIHASHVKGFGEAEKRFSICAVCGVGLGDTGTQCAEVRTATKIPEGMPLFTLQGGINRSRLKGMDKLMISMLTKGLTAQKRRTAQEERMLELLQTDASYVSEENLNDILNWYEDSCR